MKIYNKDIHTADPKLRKMVLVLDAGVPGTESHRAYLVPESASEEGLSSFAWQEALDHADMYGMYNRGDYLDMPEEELEENGIDLDDPCYTDDISGHWEAYDENTHDGQLIFGYSCDFEWVEY